MTELLAMTCDACGEPMLPNVSTLDADGCLWICINPRCPELHAEELDAADLEEAGVPRALAGRLARLILHYVAEGEEPPRTREDAQADLATLRAQLLEMGRLAETTAAIAGRLDDALSVSYQATPSTRPRRRSSPSPSPPPSAPPPAAPPPRPSATSTSSTPTCPASCPSAASEPLSPRLISPARHGAQPRVLDPPGGRRRLTFTGGS